MKSYVCFLAVFAFAAVLLAPIARSAAPVTTVSGYVTPTTGDVNDQYVFVMKYTGAVPISAATVHINGEAHPMTEVDPDDHNATNGKDYEYKTSLAQGANVYFFEAVDANSNSTISSTYAISVDNWFNFAHTDIVVLLIVLVIPLLYAVYLLRRTAKAIERLGDQPGAKSGAERKAANPEEPKAAPEEKKDG